MNEVLVLPTGDISCNGQGICSDTYRLVRFQHGKVTCLIIVNVDRQLVRDLENIVFRDHSEVAFFIPNSLNLH